MASGVEQTDVGRGPSSRADPLGDRAGGLRAAAIAVAMLVGVLTAITGAGQGLEHGLLAARAGLRARPASGKVALVEIDARSLADNPRWPWPRSLYGRAVQAIARAGGTLAAFDIDVSAASSPDQDRAFAEALARSPIPVVLPTFAQPSSDRDSGRLENAPLTAFRDHAELAAVNIEADSDGVVRRYPYGMTTGGLPRPSMAAMLAGVSGPSGRSFPVDSAIEPTSLPRFSFEDLVAGRLPPGALKGRSVIVGATAIELGDRYPTPTHGVLPGVVVQVLAAETLIQHTALPALGPLLPLLAAGLALVALRRLGGAARAAALAGVATGLLALSLVFEWLRWASLDVVPALVAVATAAVLLAAASASSAIRRARLSDAATGLPNGRALVEGLSRGIGAAGVLTLRIRDHGDLLSVLGEQGVSRVVGKLADRVKVSTGADVHRVGNDALAWPLAAGLEAEHLDEQVAVLNAILRPPVEVEGRFFDVVCAYGFAGLDAGPGLSVSQSLLAATRAVERNTRLERHHADWSEQSDIRLSLAADIDSALASGDVWVAYQPKLDVASGRIKSVEALARWRHRERGALSPEVFIPLLEAAGRMPELTLHVLSRVLCDLERWSGSGLEIGAAVNISALLPADADFMAEFSARLAASPIDPSSLTVEVTESAALADPDRAAVALRRLAALGVRVSIDDYGAGQSTLSYLRLLPASEIKIDKSFVTDLASSRSDQAMVRSSIDLAHELGLKVVAEGVESREVLDILRGYGCDTVQGWLAGRPMDASELEALLRLPPAASAVPERREPPDSFAHRSSRSRA